MHRLLTFCLLLCLSSTLLAQQDRLDLVPKEQEGLGLKPEIRISAGVSIPLGKYALLDSISSKNGAAKLGGFFDLVLTHRLRRAPLWGIHIAAGFMQHGFKSQAIKDTFQLYAFTGKPWAVGYLMPGFGFQAGKRFKVEAGLHVGLHFFNGWNAFRGDLYAGSASKTGYYYTRDWRFPIRMAAGFRGSLLLGYKINDRCMIFAQGWVQYAWGSRIGTLTKQYFDLDSNNIPSETPYDSENLRIIHSTVIFTVNVGIGIKYNLYRYLNEPSLPSETEKL